MNADYIRTARSKGLTSGFVILRHALKNAMLSVVTIFGVLLGSLLGGSIITESVFNYPALAPSFCKPFSSATMALFRALSSFISLIFMTVNLLVDITYAYLGPRIRYQ